MAALHLTIFALLFLAPAPLPVAGGKARLDTKSAAQEVVALAGRLQEGLAASLGSKASVGGEDSPWDRAWWLDGVKKCDDVRAQVEADTEQRLSELDAIKVTLNEAEAHMQKVTYDEPTGIKASVARIGGDTGAGTGMIFAEVAHLVGDAGAGAGSADAEGSAGGGAHGRSIAGGANLSARIQDMSAAPPDYEKVVAELAAELHKDLELLSTTFNDPLQHVRSLLRAVEEFQSQLRHDLQELVTMILGVRARFDDPTILGKVDDPEGGDAGGGPAATAPEAVGPDEPPAASDAALVGPGGGGGVGVSPGAEDPDPTIGGGGPPTGPMSKEAEHQKHGWHSEGGHWKPGAAAAEPKADPTGNNWKFHHTGAWFPTPADP